MKLKRKIGKGNVQLNNRNFVGKNKVLSNNPIIVQNFNKFKAEQFKQKSTLTNPKNKFVGNAFSNIPTSKVSGEEVAKKNNFGSFIDESGKLEFKKTAKQIELEERGIK